MFELRALLRTIATRERGFHVLAGDFNTLAPGELLDAGKLPFRLRTLVWLSGGRIRWRTVQMVADAGYLDAFRTRHPDVAGMTFPARDPHVRLDYIFLPNGFTARLAGCEVGVHPLARDASDHLPLVADLS
jgi:exodeoxyribonuclease-3